MLGLRKPNFKTNKISEIEGGPFGVFKKFSKKKQKMRILSLIVPKNLKKKPWDLLTFVVANNQTNQWEEKCSKKSLTAEKGGSLIVRKKRSFCFGILVKKLAHTHRFEHEPSGLKSKHRTRPRTPELCDLRTETRELSPGKKHPHFPITLAYRKCNQRL